jgi:hypothetical protein
LRPKKKVLVVGMEGTQLGALRFLLQTNGFEVITAERPAAAKAVLLQMEPDLLLMVWPLLLGKALLKQAKRIRPHLHTLVLVPDKDYVQFDWTADSVLFRSHCGSGWVLDRVKERTARKHGPPPGTLCRPKPKVDA